MTRSARFLMMAFAVSLAMGTIVLAAEQPSEPKAPQATAAVRAVLDEGERLLGENKAEQALAAAERGLDSAGGKDVAGQAYSQRLRARSLEALGRFEDSLGAWRQAASLWEQLGAGPEEIEALCAQALLLSRSDSAAAAPLIEKAVSLASQEKTRPLAAASVLNTSSERSWRTGRTEIAQRLASSALTITEKLAPGSLDLAGSLKNLGNVAFLRGDLDAAQDFFQRTLDIREKLAPGSLDVAVSLGSLGNVAYSRGDLDAAQDFFQRTLDIREKLTPGSLGAATSLINLGNVALSRGDLEAASRYYQRSLAIREKLAPGSLAVAASLNNLGLVASGRGDLDAAQEYYRRALTIQEKLAPSSIDVASMLNNLGRVAGERGDLDAARDHFQRALAIREKLAPESLDVAESLTGLGSFALSRGDLEAARDHYQRALVIEEKLAPGSLTVAYSLDNLGTVASYRGDLDTAQNYFQRALAIQEMLAPGSLSVPWSLNNLGNVARGRGDLTEAEDYLARAWSLVRGQRRGIVGDEAGRAFSAAQSTYAADLVQVRIDRGKSVAGFEALEEGRAQGLLQLVSERGLGQTGVDPDLWRRYEGAERAFQKASQELASAGEQEVQLEREVVETAGSSGDAAVRATKEADLSKAKKAREAALSAYTQARLEQEQLLREVRLSVPGLQPRSFSFEEARRALSSGSVFIAWLVGKEESSVFVIPADPKRPVEARSIPLGEKQLAKRVETLRERISAGGISRGVGGLVESEKPPSQVPAPAPGRKAAEQPPVDPALISASHELFETLFPAEARAAVAAARRVILSPDGPLWELPFASLATHSSGKPGWLGLDKPLSYTPSLTLLALERERALPSASGGLQVLVVGDPVFQRVVPETKIARTAGVKSAVSTAGGTARGVETPPAAGVESPTTDPIESAPASPTSPLRGERSYLIAGGSLPPPLPASAEEARRIAAFYRSEPLVGEAATEKAVRARISSAQVVHLATHGYFHPRLAMSSGVLLTPPSVEPAAGATEDDGALQAWEFGRNLPLGAQLVVLSACETGRGEKVRGEGLVGLTRALQGAGARSVVATQWKVADESTARLMVSFHEKLRGGVAKDEALRRAMAETAAKAGTNPPFYWAAFFLTGDADRPLALGR